jgi:hypothetical protein
MALIVRVVIGFDRSTGMPHIVVIVSSDRVVTSFLTHLVSRSR